MTAPRLGPTSPRLVPETRQRLLPRQPTADLAGHVDHFGPRPDGGRRLIAEVDRAGLRGRGGAGFPTAVKMQAVAQRHRSVVVANGTEGEPASSKDKALLTLAPHLVLDGAVAAAEAVGARRVILCIERSAGTAIDAVFAALDERREERLDRLVIEVATTPSRYVVGEESALVQLLNGGEAKPTFVPPRPFERGVGGQPTLVQNVETLAHVGLIERFGAAWFRSVGTLGDPGTMLVTVSGAVRHPGVYEVPLGVAVSAVIAHAGGSSAGLAAVLVGGYFGTWISASDDAVLGRESLGRLRAALGCGVLIALPSGACGLLQTAGIVRWLAAQNAGQCGPCVNGLSAIAAAMDLVALADPGGDAERRLQRWLAMVKGRGACRLPDGTARLVESGLRVFADEVTRHRVVGPCPAARQIPLPLPTPGGWR